MVSMSGASRCESCILSKGGEAEVIRKVERAGRSSQAFKELLPEQILPAPSISRPWLTVAEVEKVFDSATGSQSDCLLGSSTERTVS
jgi:hypothetical protein